MTKIIRKILQGTTITVCVFILSFKAVALIPLPAPAPSPHGSGGIFPHPLVTVNPPLTDMYPIPPPVPTENEHEGPMHPSVPPGNAHELALQPPEFTHPEPRVMLAPTVPDNETAYASGIAPYLFPHEYPTINHQIPKNALLITLREAILLALRYNQDVEGSELTRVVDKYALFISQREFVPKYALTGSSTFTSANNPQYAVNGGVTVKTPIGTQLTVDYATSFPQPGRFSNFGNVTFTALQPLLRGFGFVNKIQLLDAYDTEEQARFRFEESIVTVVINVITAYRTVVQDFNNLDTQKANLDITQTLIKQLKLQLKAGKIAQSDLITQEAQLAQTQLGYTQAQVALQQDYRAFLNSIGLLPDANINIVRTIPDVNYKIMPAKQAIDIALGNNIQYQSQLISFRAIQRNVILAADQRLPELNVTATESFMPANRFIAPGQLQPAVLRGDTTTSSSVVANFVIPIDDVESKAGLVDATIGVLQAKFALDQAKENLIRTILNDLSALKSLQEQLRLSEQSVKLQDMTYHNSQLSFKYGRTTAFEVRQNLNILLSQQLQLISLRIQFLNQITAFESDLGITLDEWNIKLRY